MLKNSKKTYFFKKNKHFLGPKTKKIKEISKKYEKIAFF